MGSGKSASKRASRAAEASRADEQARQERIRTGTSEIGKIFDTQFNDDFFAKQRQSFVDYNMPQLEEQKADADKQLLFSMDRSGNTESSARAGLAGELEKRAGIQRQSVLDEGQNFANQTRGNVESARSDLISMLNVTGDAQGAANSALARSAALSQPGTFSPLGNLFADFTGGLGVQAAAERARFYGGAGTPGAARYSTGLFAPRTGAVQVT